MKYLTATLAAACAVLLGVVSYQAIPNSKPTPTHSAAYQRIDTMLAALQKGDYAKACEVLEWWSANQFVTDEQCQVGMQATFPKAGHMLYRMLGDTTGRTTYHIVTATIVLDDPFTKLDESAFCAARWADGKDCKYASVYTFGTALQSNVKDTIAGKKHARQHWYVFWVD